MHPRFEIDVIWRYAKGHRNTAIHSTSVRTSSAERAEAWGRESIKRKFPNEEIEIVKVNVVCEE